MISAIAAKPVPLVTPSDMLVTEKLEDHLNALEGAFSENSVRAMKADVTQFVIWCHENGQIALPASSETISQYVGEMSATYAPATVKRRLSSIGHFHRAVGEDDFSKSQDVRIAVRRMDRRNDLPQRQAAALTAEDVNKIIAYCSGALIDLRDAAMLLTARDLLGRRSEIVALQVDDVEISADGSGTATIRRSKTDQIGDGAAMWLSPDTVQAIQSWINASGVEDGALFRSVRKGGRVGGALSAEDVSRRFKVMAKRAGVNPSGISGHSPRIGMTQDLCAAGMELTELMLAGRWKSPKMPARYAEKLNAARGAVAKYHSQKTFHGV